MKESQRKKVPTSDLDFDFLKEKTRQLLNDVIASAILFDEKIIANGDVSEFVEMPTVRLKIYLNALANGNIEKFNEKYEEFCTDIEEENQRYRENNILMFGPLNEIDEAVGIFGSFTNTLSYPVLTTAKPNREAMLPKKDGTKVLFQTYLENPKEAKELTKKSIFEVTKEVMNDELGKSLN